MGVCPLFNGGTLKNLTMQVISGSMYKSTYIGHNVQEKVVEGSHESEPSAIFNYGDLAD